MAVSPGARRLIYGRHKGHRLRPRQAALVETVLPHLSLDLEAAAPLPATQLFDPPVEDVHLEIGFGGGEHLCRAAAQEGGIGFIGCEPFINGIAKLLVAIDEQGLHNIRIHCGDGRAVLDWLPVGALGRIWLLYPDPWPKRRHWKRRFINPDNLDAMARVLRPGAELRFATDWPDYADWTLRHLTRHPRFEWTADRACDWRNPWRGWPGTRYEAKAIREGRVPCYLAFKRV